MELNAEQQAAALALEGLVIVDAGAGSGKTRALTQRFVNAVAPPAEIEGWTPTLVDRIVAITFTDKAAGELAERIRESLRTTEGLAEQARRVDVAWISTIHSFCSRILRENALLAGLDPQFGVADGVTAGELAEACFESAARSAIDRDPAAGALFAEYGYGRVYSAVQTIRRELIKRGLGAEALCTEPTADAKTLLEAAVALLCETADDVAACSDPRKSVIDGEQTVPRGVRASLWARPDTAPAADDGRGVVAGTRGAAEVGTGLATATPRRSWSTLPTGATSCAARRSCSR